MMTVLTLHRTDPTKNLHRYYRLDVQRDLFGEWLRYPRVGPYPVEGLDEGPIARHQGTPSIGPCVASGVRFPITVIGKQQIEPGVQAGAYDPIWSASAGISARARFRSYIA
jgi:hypothetical protein